MTEVPAALATERVDAPRVVLDSNACLDLFVFADPRATALLHALQAGSVVAVTDAACRDEWRRVLTYPQLTLDATARDAASAAFDALVRCLDEATLAAPQPLPRCADPDDQKFLELAQRSGARWLLSRDDAVLKLGRRTRRDGLFDILAPQDWPPADKAPNLR